MDTENKIKIESHGVSPWHYYLENMSWGFSRASDDGDAMAFLNVDSNLADGGRGLEDVLMADFLQSLSFIGDDFIKALVGKAGGANEKAKLGKCEVRGNAGNYYIPYGDAANGIRLVQSDGWIADGKTLLLLEAKGYRKSASLNKGQLAKEFLIARNVAANTGRMDGFFVFLIVNKLDNIYTTDAKGKLGLSDGTFEELWRANVHDLEQAFGKVLKEKLPEDGPGSWDEFKRLSAETVREHFLWITWADIADLARSDFKDDQCAQQIAGAIEFHSSTVSAGMKSEDWPIFSQLLAELARKEEKENGKPLYRFYNGGCGDPLLIGYEKKYLEAIGYGGEDPWGSWHELSGKHAKLLGDLSALEERRRIALSQLRQAEKDIGKFYRERLGIQKAPRTTRRAFGMLGESSLLESRESSFFVQSMSVDRKKLEQAEQKRS